VIVARRGNFTNFLFSPSLLLLLLLLLLLYRLRTIIFSFRYRYDRQRTSLVCVLTLVSRIPIRTAKIRACLSRRSWSQSRSPFPPPTIILVDFRFCTSRSWFSSTGQFAIAPISRNGRDYYSIAAMDNGNRWFRFLRIDRSNAENAREKKQH